MLYIAAGADFFDNVRLSKSDKQVNREGMFANLA